MFLIKQIIYINISNIICFQKKKKKKKKKKIDRYNLGPNGGILTSLNLFTTKFDQVLDFIDKRSKEVE